MAERKNYSASIEKFKNQSKQRKVRDEKKNQISNGRLWEIKIYGRVSDKSEIR